MHESFFGNNPHQVRGRRLEWAAERPDDFRQVTIEELRNITDEGRQLLTDNHLEFSASNLAVVYEWSLGKVMSQSQFDIQLQFAYAATRFLTPNIETKDCSSTEVDLDSQALLEAIKTTLGNVVEYASGVAEFDVMDGWDLEEILSMSPEEAAARTKEVNFEQFSISNDIKIQILEQKEKIMQELLARADEARNKIGARANESQKYLEENNHTKSVLEELKQLARSGYFREAQREIGRVNGQKKAENLSLVLDDYVAAHVVRVLESESEEALTVAMDCIQYFASEAEAKSLMRAIITPILQRRAEDLARQERYDEVEFFILAAPGHLVPLVKETLNAVYIEIVFRMIRDAEPAARIERFIQDRIFGNHNKELAKSAVITYYSS